MAAFIGITLTGCDACGTNAAMPIETGGTADGEEIGVGVADNGNWGIAAAIGGGGAGCDVARA
ncbi:hypothetical protein, partial [Lysobacter sp. 1R34A]|uniref:hypothetical protein n=1 Tax=Lysobacter sp. 1R34A TaxID=3445786 RepID=UPI003EEABA6C